jgi:beta-mannosidase
MSALARVTTSLHQGWTLTHTGGAAPSHVAGVTVPAEVPGTNHTSLLAAGLIPDPYLGTNEKELEWMWTTTWRYAVDLEAAGVRDGERVDLVFDGLDTVATVHLNGTQVGQTFNMHRSYRFDIRDVLTPGTNALAVDFSSALEYASSREQLVGERPRAYAHPFNAVRKMACSFGWDWGPDLQTAGIWRGVRLERWRVARLASVRPVVTVADGVGTVELHIEVERASDEPLIATASVAGQEAHASLLAGETTTVVTITVPQPELWWPAGYGAATLYTLTVDLHTTDEHLDTTTQRIGFRTIELDTSPDQHGTRFTVVVNGQPVLIKGANWIPDDHLLTRITRERLERRIDQAQAAHVNLLRVWGGGIYESDDFYALCDHKGMLVWQDFLFACAAYAEDDVTRAEVEAEARENVTRLAPHPSLALYNGSNENVWGWVDWGWQDVTEDLSWGLGYYDELLPRVLAELDPTRPYIPSSPYSTHPYDDSLHPNDAHHGTVHEWQVWNQVDYTAYRNYVPRFCAEFGFQGPATWSTLQRTLSSAGFDQSSAEWLLHQKAQDGNAKLNRGFAAHLSPGTDFEAWHWVTQLNQARAVRLGIEHYRSHWPVCTGSIVWQLNDCWPVTSWSAIDGDEKPKPLWFALRQAYAPRLLTFQPRGADGGNDPHGTMALVALNDTAADWNETLTFTRMALDGVECATATVHLSVPARGATTLAVPSHVLEATDPAREVLMADAGYPGDSDHARAIHTFAEDKDVAYVGMDMHTDVTARPGGYTLTVTARSFVRDLTVLADKLAADAQVDDALVSLAAGESHTFVITTAQELDPGDLVSGWVLVAAESMRA